MLDLHNFVLYISNNKIGIFMKKSYFAFGVSGLLAISLIVVFFSGTGKLPFSEILQYIIIGLLVVFGIFFGISRLKSEKSGEPTEDELSKRIMMKAASYSYFISLYVWLAIMYIADKKVEDTDILFGWGIIAMAVVFALSWIFVYFFGTKNE